VIIPGAIAQPPGRVDPPADPPVPPAPDIPALPPVEAPALPPVDAPPLPPVPPPVHIPATQDWPAPQGLPHVPQFDTFDCVSTQAPAHVT